MSKGTGLNLELQSQKSWQRAAFVGLAKGIPILYILQRNPRFQTSATDLGQNQAPSHTKPSYRREKGPSTSSLILESVITFAKCLPQSEINIGNSDVKKEVVIMQFFCPKNKRQRTSEQFHL